MSERPVDYARLSHAWSEHHRRFAAYVQVHGLPCQECRGFGRIGHDSDYGPAEPCGWCETTGKVTRWLRGMYLRTMREEKRQRAQRAA